jgi:hypothetical protein
MFNSSTQVNFPLQCSSPTTGTSTTVEAPQRHSPEIFFCPFAKASPLSSSLPGSFCILPCSVARWPCAAASMVSSERAVSCTDFTKLLHPCSLLCMLASSAGLFLYQQQKQHTQRRRDLQHSILSTGNAVVKTQFDHSMSDDDSSVVLDFREDFNDACSVSRYRFSQYSLPAHLSVVTLALSASICSLSGSSRAPTPLDAFHGDFLELGVNGNISENEVHSPMLSRSGSNCSDEDSSQTARSRLWMEHLQAPHFPVFLLAYVMHLFRPVYAIECLWRFSSTFVENSRPP